MSEFPMYCTIDNEGLESLCYFLEKEYSNKTVLITIIREGDK